jgi:hypothetical protein
LARENERFFKKELNIKPPRSLKQIPNITPYVRRKLVELQHKSNKMPFLKAAFKVDKEKRSRTFSDMPVLEVLEGTQGREKDREKAREV